MKIVFVAAILTACIPLTYTAQLKYALKICEKKPRTVSEAAYCMYYCGKAPDGKWKYNTYDDGLNCDYRGTQDGTCYGGICYQKDGLPTPETEATGGNEGNEGKGDRNEYSYTWTYTDRLKNAVKACGERRRSASEAANCIYFCGQTESGVWKYGTFDNGIDCNYQGRLDGTCYNGYCFQKHYIATHGRETHSERLRLAEKVCEKRQRPNSEAAVCMYYCGRTPDGGWRYNTYDDGLDCNYRGTSDGICYNGVCNQKGSLATPGPETYAEWLRNAVKACEKRQRSDSEVAVCAYYCGRTDEGMLKYNTYDDGLDCNFRATLDGTCYGGVCYQKGSLPTAATTADGNKGQKDKNDQTEDSYEWTYIDRFRNAIKICSHRVRPTDEAAYCMYYCGKTESGLWKYGAYDDRLDCNFRGTRDGTCFGGICYKKGFRPTLVYQNVTQENGLTYTDRLMNASKDCEKKQRSHMEAAHCMYYCGHTTSGQWRYGTYDDGLDCNYRGTWDGTCYGGVCYQRSSLPVPVPGTPNVVRGRGHANRQSEGKQRGEKKEGYFTWTYTHQLRNAVKVCEKRQRSVAEQAYCMYYCGQNENGLWKYGTYDDGLDCDYRGTWDGTCYGGICYQKGFVPTPGYETETETDQFRIAVKVCEKRQRLDSEAAQCMYYCGHSETGQANYGPFDDGIDCDYQGNRDGVCYRGVCYQRGSPPKPGPETEIDKRRNAIRGCEKRQRSDSEAAHCMYYCGQTSSGLFKYGIYDDGLDCNYRGTWDGTCYNGLCYQKGSLRAPVPEIGTEAEADRLRNAVRACDRRQRSGSEAGQCMYYCGQTANGVWKYGTYDDGLDCNSRGTWDGTCYGGVCYQKGSLPAPGPETETVARGSFTWTYNHQLRNAEKACEKRQRSVTEQAYCMYYCGQNENGLWKYGTYDDGLDCNYQGTGDGTCYGGICYQKGFVPTPGRETETDRFRKAVKVCEKRQRLDSEAAHCMYYCGHHTATGQSKYGPFDDGLDCNYQGTGDGTCYRGICYQKGSLPKPGPETEADLHRNAVMDCEKRQRSDSESGHCMYYCGQTSSGLLKYGIYDDGLVCNYRGTWDGTCYGGLCYQKGSLRAPVPESETETDRVRNAVRACEKRQRSESEGGQCMYYCGQTASGVWKYGTYDDGLDCNYRGTSDGTCYGGFCQQKGSVPAPGPETENAARGRGHGNRQGEEKKREGETEGSFTWTYTHRLRNAEEACENRQRSVAEQPYCMYYCGQNENGLWKYGTYDDGLDCNYRGTWDGTCYGGICYQKGFVPTPGHETESDQFRIAVKVCEKRQRLDSEAAHCMYYCGHTATGQANYGPFDDGIECNYQGNRDGVCYRGICYERGSPPKPGPETEADKRRNAVKDCEQRQRSDSEAGHCMYYCGQTSSGLLKYGIYDDGLDCNYRGTSDGTCYGGLCYQKGSLRAPVPETEADRVRNAVRACERRQRSESEAAQCMYYCGQTANGVWKYGTYDDGLYCNYRGTRDGTCYGGVCYQKGSLPAPGPETETVARGREHANRQGEEKKREGEREGSFTWTYTHRLRNAEKACEKRLRSVTEEAYCMYYCGQNQNGLWKYGTYDDGLDCNYQGTWDGTCYDGICYQKGFVPTPGHETETDQFRNAVKVCEKRQRLDTEAAHCMYYCGHTATGQSKYGPFDDGLDCNYQGTGDGTCFRGICYQKGSLPKPGPETEAEQRRNTVKDCEKRQRSDSEAAHCMYYCGQTSGGLLKYGMYDDGLVCNYRGTWDGTCYGGRCYQKGSLRAPVPETETDADRVRNAVRACERRQRSDREAGQCLYYCGQTTGGVWKYGTYDDGLDCNYRGTWDGTCYGGVCYQKGSIPAPGPETETVARRRGHGNRQGEEKKREGEREGSLTWTYTHRLRNAEKACEKILRSVTEEAYCMYYCGQNQNGLWKYGTYDDGLDCNYQGTWDGTCYDGICYQKGFVPTPGHETETDRFRNAVKVCEKRQRLDTEAAHCMYYCGHTATGQSKYGPFDDGLDCNYQGTGDGTCFRGICYQKGSLPKPGPETEADQRRNAVKDCEKRQRSDSEAAHCMYYCGQTSSGLLKYGIYDDGLVCNYRGTWDGICYSGLCYQKGSLREPVLETDRLRNAVRECDRKQRPDSEASQCMYYCGQTANGVWKYGTYDDGLECNFRGARDGTCYGGKCYQKGSLPAPGPETETETDRLRNAVRACERRQRSNSEAGQCVYYCGQTASGVWKYGTYDDGLECNYRGTWDGTCYGGVCYQKGSLPPPGPGTPNVTRGQGHGNRPSEEKKKDEKKEDSLTWTYTHRLRNAVKVCKKRQRSNREAAYCMYYCGQTDSGLWKYGTYDDGLHCDYRGSWDGTCYGGICYQKHSILTPGSETERVRNAVRACEKRQRSISEAAHCMYYCGQTASGGWKYGIYDDGLDCNFRGTGDGSCYDGLCYEKGSPTTPGREIEIGVVRNAVKVCEKRQRPDGEAAHCMYFCGKASSSLWKYGTYDDGLDCDFQGTSDGTCYGGVCTKKGSPPAPVPGTKENKTEDSYRPPYNDRRRHAVNGCRKRHRLATEPPYCIYYCGQTASGIWKYGMFDNGLACSFQFALDGTCYGGMCYKNGSLPRREVEKTEEEVNNEDVTDYFSTEWSIVTNDRSQTGAKKRRGGGKQRSCNTTKQVGEEYVEVEVQVQEYARTMRRKMTRRRRVIF
ncbi:uncharacterized protein LOC135388781 isoform X2 [Ornithodoros turicata]|uniref:uncharacterized protein LOC135388781 isoform X2 n=1 Tax=Ornithodoros turicata TaxID=34597 RepID=UPI00313A08F6